MRGHAMPLDPDFVADSPYGPGGLLLDDILEVDRDRGLVVARMPTSADLPLTREQRSDPHRHPAHLNGEGDQSAMWLRTPSPTRRERRAGSA